MKVNGLDGFLEKIRAGKMPLGAAITFTDPAVTEVACASGLDFLWFDGEHGEFSRETAMLHLMAVKGTGVASLYRVPGCDHTEIKRIIDFAPAGVIIPMVLTAEDAARAVDACRYPTNGGSRGFGPRRGLDYGAGDAAEYLESLGAARLDADTASRALTAPGGAALPGIRAAFGDRFFPGGALDRRALGALVFSFQKPEDKYVKVGILHSLSGTMAISETSVRDAELLAINEINAKDFVCDIL